MAVVPALFAIMLVGLDSQALAASAAFGSIAAIVFADFGGSPRARLQAYALLGVGGAVVLAIGTLVSGSLPASVAVTVVVAGGMRFVGHFGPRWSASVSPVILALVLGALVPAPAAIIPDRVGGWLVGVFFAALASVTILASRPEQHLEDVAGDAAARLARSLRRVAVDADQSAATIATAHEDAEIVREELRAAFYAPVRPAGPGAHALARRLMLDRLIRLAVLLADPSTEGPEPEDQAARDVARLAAETLEATAALLRREGSLATLRRCLAQREPTRDAAYRAAVRRAVCEPDPAARVRQIDAGFVARAAAWHADAVARHAVVAVGAVALGELEREVDPVVPGTGVAGPDAGVRSVHAIPTSVWFRDALRAGAALGGAVALAQVLAVDHGFWVALGALSVLRSNALATGQTALRASVGTAVGFLISAVLFAAFGLDDPWLWGTFAVGVFAVGYLPQVAGFAVGQTAFTVTFVVMFNLLQPQGWRTGLTRLEDVLLGGAVSAVAALVFWPRPLAPLVARLLGEASAGAGDALVAAVGTDLAATAETRATAIVAEEHARAAVVDLVVQERASPATFVPWSVRLGIAAHSRAASEAVARIRTLDDDVVTVAVAEPLQRAAATIADALRPGVGHPAAPMADALAESTAAAAGAPDTGPPAAVVRDLFVRDWLLLVARLVDERP